MKIYIKEKNGSRFIAFDHADLITFLCDAAAGVEAARKIIGEIDLPHARETVSNIMAGEVDNGVFVKQLNADRYVRLPLGEAQWLETELLSSVGALWRFAHGSLVSSDLDIDGFRAAMDANLKTRFSRVRFSEPPSPARQR